EQGIDPSEAVFSCPTRALKLGRTEGGRLLCLSGASWLFARQCLELGRDGSCQVLSEFTTDLSFHAAAWHPQYGFAATFGSPSFLLLARVDTTGAIIQPLGVLHARDIHHYIIESDVAITDDGRVVAAWLEQSELLPDSSRRLMLATVGWNTYLSSEEVRFIPQPSSFSLSAYPNPFNSVLQIEYELAARAEIDLSVYNVLGQQVERLENGMKEAGTHRTSWSPESAGGIYFVTLRHNGNTESRKVLYLR
ncbi:MAG: T9SS type A sorting domain-containing protein, partial [bacterium]|nr:T9SS type A sorting domain-containing protein [bacterium]